MSLEKWMEKNIPKEKRGRRRGSGFDAYAEEIRILFEKRYPRYQILRFLQEEKGCLLSHEALRIWMYRNDMSRWKKS